MSLAAYLLTAMLAWTGVPTDCQATPSACAAWDRLYAEHAPDTVSRLDEIAREVASEAESRGGGARNVTRALELVAIAFEESRFSVLVDRGDCNAEPESDEMRARLRAVGGCDSRKAFTILQIHPELTADVQRGVTGADLLADRTLAIRIGWELLVVRPVAWSTWRRAEKLATAWRSGHPLPE